VVEVWREGGESKKQSSSDELDELFFRLKLQLDRSGRANPLVHALMFIDDVFVEKNISANLKTQSTEGRSRLSEHQTVTFSLAFVWMADLVALKADLKSWEKEFKLKTGREARKEDIKAVPEIGQSERRREQ